MSQTCTDQNGNSACGTLPACEHCSSNPHNQQEQPQQKLPENHIAKVIGVISGKGGVGKSMTTAMLAVEYARWGLRVGILDADITGPSIPKMFGLMERVTGSEEGIIPAVTETGIKIGRAHV